MIDKSVSYQSLPIKDSATIAISHAEPTVAPASKKILVEISIAVGVSVSWALGRQFTKSALVIDSDHFYAPFFLMWFNTCFMLLCYPVFLIYNRIFNRKTFAESHSDAQTIFTPNGLTLRSFFKCESPFLLLWTIANYAYSQALGFISASGALVLVSSNVAMVCVLERILLRQYFTPTKVIAVMLAIGGVALTSIDGQASGSWLGVLLSIVSAIFVALYKVLFKLVNGNADLSQTSIFLTGLGVLNLFVNAIPMFGLLVLNIEHNEFEYIPWLPLVLAALLSTVFNFLTNFGIALLGPFAISVGMLFGIPISTVIDIVARSMSMSIWFFIGSIGIISSFALVVFPVDDMFQYLNTRCRHKQ